MSTYRGLRRGFRVLNRYFVVPAFRSGLGAAMVTPPSGYIMVLSTIGHKSGKLRHTPVNYALIDGEVYCIAGFGEVAHWAKNLSAIPEAEVQLPAGRFWGRVNVVKDEAKRLRIARQILKNAGFAGFFFGFDPFTTSDDKLARGIAGVPVLQITPIRVLPAAFDPGGTGWIVSILGWILLAAMLIVALAR